MLKLKKTVAAVVLGLGCVGFAQAEYAGELSYDNPIISGSFTVSSWGFTAPVGGLAFTIDRSLIGIADSTLHIQLWIGEGAVFSDRADAMGLDYIYHPTGGNPFRIDYFRGPTDGGSVIDIELSLENPNWGVVMDRYGENTFEFTVGFVGRGDFTLDYILTATAAIPEPETYAMLLAGLGIVGAVARRRKVNVN